MDNQHSDNQHSDVNNAVDTWKESAKAFTDGISKDPSDFKGHIDRAIDLIGDAAKADAIIDRPVDQPR